VTRYSLESSILEYHLHILKLEAEELQCLRQAHVTDYCSHLQFTHIHRYLRAEPIYICFIKFQLRWRCSIRLGRCQHASIISTFIHHEGRIYCCTYIYMLKYLFILLCIIQFGRFISRSTITLSTSGSIFWCSCQCQYNWLTKKTNRGNELVRIKWDIKHCSLTLCFLPRYLSLFLSCHTG